jgi:hypothetical protein
MQQIILSIILAMSIPSALTSILFSRLEKRIEEKENAKEECSVLLIQGVRAAISLGEASAIALRDGKTNGETKEALEYAKNSKQDINNFLAKQTAKNIC